MASGGKLGVFTCRNCLFRQRIIAIAIALSTYFTACNKMIRFGKNFFIVEYVKDDILLDNLLMSFPAFD
jgi:hypothetical protein